MCELFSMSSSEHTNVTFSLDEFSQHGGLTAPHKDGWGVAFYADKDVQIIREADSASNSDCLSFIKDHPFYSTTVISHIRRATQGELKLENTQPFCRELGGRMHVFAHNGDLMGIHEDKCLKQSVFQTVGDTDSEYAFCGLMNLLKNLWSSTKPPSMMDRYSVVSYFAELIRPYGPANFIYADSEFVFAHGHKRTHDGETGYRPPGLHVLSRQCSVENTDDKKIKGLEIQTLDKQQNVVLLASVPLTNEPWEPLNEGEVIAISNGKIVDINEKTHEGGGL